MTRSPEGTEPLHFEDQPALTCTCPGDTHLSQCPLKVTDATLAAGYKRADHLPRSAFYADGRTHYVGDGCQPPHEVFISAPEDDEEESPEEHQAVAEAKADIAAGRTRPAEEVFAELAAQRHQYEARGRHATLDLSGCDRFLLNNARMLHNILTRAVQAVGATVLSATVYPFEPQGVSVVLILGESHASIHTYPEHGVCMVDVFTCGSTIDPDKAVELVAQDIPHVRSHQQTLERGVAPRRR